MGSIADTLLDVKNEGNEDKVDLLISSNRPVAKPMLLYFIAIYAKR